MCRRPARAAEIGRKHGSCHFALVSLHELTRLVAKGGSQAKLWLRRAAVYPGHRPTQMETGLGCVGLAASIGFAPEATLGSDECKSRPSLALASGRRHWLTGLRAGSAPVWTTPGVAAVSVAGLPALVPRAVRMRVRARRFSRRHALSVGCGHGWLVWAPFHIGFAARAERKWCDANRGRPGGASPSDAAARILGGQEPPRLGGHGAEKARVASLDVAIGAASLVLGVPPKSRPGRSTGREGFRARATRAAPLDDKQLRRWAACVPTRPTRRAVQTQPGA